MSYPYYYLFATNTQLYVQDTVLQNERRENESVAKIYNFAEKTVPLYFMDDFR